MMKKSRNNLNISSSSIIDGVLEKKYGGYGDEPRVSFPLEWSNVKEAKSYALYVIDYDAIHVVGYPFIHWVVANIHENKLEFDATHKNKSIIQGQNSLTTVGWRNSQGREISKEELLRNANYMGPYPPDKTHTYTIFVFALDVDNLNLKDGFFLDEMLHEMEDHIIQYDKINFSYVKPN